jgi:hypothetical protein
MPSFKVYIPFTYSYGGEIVEEQFNTLVDADNESDATKKALKELSEEYVVKNLDSRLIEVELCPDFTSFDEWEEKYSALKNPKNEGDTGLSEIMFETYGDELQTVTSHEPNKIWTVRDTEYGLLLTAGLGMIDRFGYILSEQPCDEADVDKAFRV